MGLVIKSSYDSTLSSDQVGDNSLELGHFVSRLVAGKHYLGLVPYSSELGS
jgi:hypothetical protein